MTDNDTRQVVVLRCDKCGGFRKPEDIAVRVLQPAYRDGDKDSWQGLVALCVACDPYHGAHYMADGTFRVPSVADRV